jgi:hypothetical protein
MRPEASGRGAPRREKGEKNVVMGRAKEADPEKDPIDQQDSNTAAPGQGIGRTNNRLRISARTASRMLRAEIEVRRSEFVLVLAQRRAIGNLGI